MSAAHIDEMLASLRRLSFAALCRDSTMGDPCRLIEVKAELAAAAKHADAVIAKVTEAQRVNADLAINRMKSGTLQRMEIDRAHAAEIQAGDHS